MPSKRRCPRRRSELHAHGTALVPERAGDFAQALMDLGSAICTPKRPACPNCPWTEDCLARKRGIQEALPVKAPKMRAALEARRRLCGARQHRRGAAGQAPGQGLAGLHAGAAAGTLDGRISVNRAGAEAGTVSRRTGKSGPGWCATASPISNWRSKSISPMSPNARNYPGRMGCRPRNCARWRCPR